MEKFYTTLILLLCAITLGTSQVVYPIYNSSDSTFTFSYPQSIEIAKIKKQKRLLEKEIEILQSFEDQNSRVIKKLMDKDSLSRIEIESCDRMNQGLLLKIENSTSIIDNYRKNLDDVNSKLVAEEKKRKREAFWKNLYKISAPIIGIVTFVLTSR